MLSGTPDIVFPARRSAIFVHGCFWHGHHCKAGKLPETRTEFWREKIARNRDRDIRNVAELEAEGWRVLTVWQCELREVEVATRQVAEWLRCSPENAAGETRRAGHKLLSSVR